MDICQKWLSDVTRNPRTNRRIKNNGPVFTKLVKECKSELSHHLIIPRLTSRHEVVNYFLTLFNNTIFSGMFDIIQIKFEPIPEISKSEITRDGCTIIISDKIKSLYQIRDVLIHEMSFIMSRDDIDRNKYVIRTMELFPSIRPPLKCYPSTSGCDKCGNGIPFVAGTGDCGQLGLGSDIYDISRPRVVSHDQCVQVCAGGLHSIYLTIDGDVYTFGCNDEHALGRMTDDENCFIPGIVNLPEKILQISAGDSHSAALSVTGKVYIWGTFRNSNGPIGLTPKQTSPVSEPVVVPFVQKIVKISSGSDHLVFLDGFGNVITIGNCEQGQLGRIPRNIAIGKLTKKKRENILYPGYVKIDSIVEDVWAGHYCTFVKTEKGKIYSFGLNNYYQLGFMDINSRYLPENPPLFNNTSWDKISCGQHHTLALSSGELYSIGRIEYGRLGAGNIVTDAPVLRHILSDCKDAAAGIASSFCVTQNGQFYSWGAADSQLCQGDDDVNVPTLVAAKSIRDVKCVAVSAGGQHVMILAC